MLSPALAHLSPNGVRVANGHARQFTDLWDKYTKTFLYKKISVQPDILIALSKYLLETRNIFVTKMKSTTHSHVKNRHWSSVSSLIKRKELEKGCKWDYGSNYDILKVMAH